MKNKRGLVVLILSIALIIVLLLLGYSIYYFYFKKSAENISTQSPKTPSKPSTPSRCSTIQDDYQLPDFSNLKSLLEKQDLIKDFPEKGSMRLRFYHFTQGCRIWDKAYYISGGEIQEKNTKADIDVWIHSDYAPRLNENNLCDIIIEARNNGDLGQWSELGKTTLMWRYKSLLKYKECLGIEI